MSRQVIAEQNCSIARALAVVGERWTLLVVRELALGRSRFGDIRSEVGVSTNILSDRLASLIEHGLVTRTPVPGPGLVHDYALTDKGRDLLPVLVALNSWGDRYAAGEAGAPRAWWHTDCGHTSRPHLVCDHCGELIEPDGVRVGPGPGADDKQRREGLLPRSA